jgi:23S rRNA (guanosine2251-2'-O)-methyltransferase
MRADLQSAAFNHSATPPPDRTVFGLTTVITQSNKAKYVSPNWIGNGLIVMKNPGRKRSNAKNRTKSEKNFTEGPIWLWGIHAVLAALDNPAREIQRLCVTKNALTRLPDHADTLKPEEMLPKDIDHLLPRDAVHQGMAALVAPLPELALDDVLSESRIVVFDQLTDPHNIGAIFRSASAFGFTAAILQTRNVPPITGVAAKTAAGAVETVKEVRVVNISRALETLNEAGFHTVGLDGDGDVFLKDAVMGVEKLAIIIGAEGSGIRPGVAKACAQIARIPISSAMESLNASNAAAIAFYEARKD